MHKKVSIRFYSKKEYPIAGSRRVIRFWADTFPPQQQPAEIAWVGIEPTTFFNASALN